MVILVIQVSGFKKKIVYNFMTSQSELIEIFSLVFRKSGFKSIRFPQIFGYRIIYSLTTKRKCSNQNIFSINRGKKLMQKLYHILVYYKSIYLKSNTLI